MSRSRREQAQYSDQFLSAYGLHHSLERYSLLS